MLEIQIASGQRLSSITVYAVAARRINSNSLVKRRSKEDKIKLKIIESELPVIVFNGVTLPFGSFFIDFCASGRLFPDIDDDLSLWFWRFTICVGKEKEDESSLVVSYASKLRTMIIENEKKVTRKLHGYYVAEQVELIKQSWLSTLDVMISSASERGRSLWFGIEAAEGEPPTQIADDNAQ